MDKAKLMMFNTFFSHLLFDPEAESEKNIRLLIFGADRYAAALKQAFSCGQVAGRCLHIAMAVPEKKGTAKVRAALLAEMPGLESFARVAEDWCGDDESGGRYADICFVQSSFGNDDVKRVTRRFSPNYIICSVGSDEDDRRVAQAAASACRASFTGYVCKKKGNASGNRRITPIFPVSRIEQIDPELRRMAFNSHFVYEKNYSERTAAGTIFRQFSDNNYNSESSYAFALHIRYKLASLGIAADDPCEAAGRFSRLINESGGTALRELAYYEHRRWCAYSIADGLQAPPDGDIGYIPHEGSFRKKFTDPVTGRTVVYHPAIALSEPSGIVLDGFDWENGDTSKLDDLDRMSVEINRVLKKNERCNDVAVADHRDALRRLNDSVNHEILAELDKNVGLILAGNRLAAEDHSALCCRLKAKLAALYPPENSSGYDELAENIDGLTRALFVRIQLLKKYDYKAVDLEMIRSIPFILRYRSDLALIQKLCPDHPVSRTQTVRAAVDLEPAALVLVSIVSGSVYDAPAPAVQLRDDIERYAAILRYHREREFCGELSLAVVMQGAEPFEELCAETERLCSVNGIPAGSVSVYRAESHAGWDGVIGGITGELRKKQTIVNGMPEDSVAYRILSELGISDLNSFRSCLIRKNYTIAEHMTLNGADITGFSIFALSGYYRKLWGLCHDRSLYDYGIYRGKSVTGPEMVWNREIRRIASAVSRTDQEIIGYIPDPDPAGDKEYASVTVPDHIAQRVLRLFVSLKELGIVSDVEPGYVRDGVCGAQTKITYRCSRAMTGYSIPQVSGKKEQKSARVKDTVYNVVEALKRRELSGSETIELKVLPDEGCVAVRLAKGTFDVKTNDRNNYNENLEVILKKLAEFGLLIDEGRDKGDPAICRYRIAFAELKDVLTVPGAILEVFVYFALKNSGFFSDVISNMRISWCGRSGEAGGDPTQNEIDAAASKGAAAMLISAKLKSFAENRDDVLKAMYEIKTLGAQFGAAPVLVSGIPGAVSERYADRAEKMDMHLIRREDYEISDENAGYDEMAELEEKKLGGLLIEIIRKYV